MSFKSYKEESRNNWGRDLEEGRSLTIEQINCGAVLRIADATEAMARRYTALLDENERLKRSVQRLSDGRESLIRSRAGCRSVITRLQKRIQALETQSKEANSLLRSAMQIAKREGRKTNWMAWRKTLAISLDPRTPPND